jgi:hypothetical protein
MIVAYLGNNVAVGVIRNADAVNNQFSQWNPRGKEIIYPRRSCLDSRQGIMGTERRIPMRRTITITLTKDQYEAINGAIVAQMDNLATGGFSTVALHRAWVTLERAWFGRKN